MPPSKEPQRFDALAPYPKHYALLSILYSLCLLHPLRSTEPRTKLQVIRSRLKYNAKRLRSWTRSLTLWVKNKGNEEGCAGVAGSCCWGQVCFEMMLVWRSRWEGSERDLAHSRVDLRWFRTSDAEIDDGRLARAVTKDATCFKHIHIFKDFLTLKAQAAKFISPFLISCTHAVAFTTTPPLLVKSVFPPTRQFILQNPGFWNLSFTANDLRRPVMSYFLLTRSCRRPKRWFRSERSSVVKCDIRDLESFPKSCRSIDAIGTSIVFRKQWRTQAKGTCIGPILHFTQLELLSS